MKQEIVGEIAKMLGGMTSGVNAEQMAEMINQAVASNMPTAVQSSSRVQGSSKVEDDEPLYIPSDITNTGTIQGGSVSVSSVSSEDSSLEDAAAALRAMKKNRRK